jgi:hypothetical protein
MGFAVSNDLFGSVYQDAGRRYVVGGRRGKTPAPSLVLLTDHGQRTTDATFSILSEPILLYAMRWNSEEQFEPFHPTR